MTRVCVCGEQIRRFVKEKPDGSLEYTAADVLNYLLGRFKEEYTVRTRGAGDRARWKPVRPWNYPWIAPRTGSCKRRLV
jgi:hypothetical protein